MSRRVSLVLDTNIWLDNYCGFRANAQAARELIAFAVEQEIPLLYPVTSLKDVFYIIAATSKRLARQEAEGLDEGDARAAKELAWGCVSNMVELGVAVGADQSDVWKAAKLRSVHDDLEDNLVLAAAQCVEGAILVTEDVRLRQDAPVAAMSAARALEFLKA